MFLDKKNYFIVKEKQFLLTVIFIKYNLFLFQIVTRYGVFWIWRLSNSFSILNLKKNLFIKNNINKKIKANIYYYSFLNLLYNSSVRVRRYFKLKGLGFSLKYLKIPLGFLRLVLGFSIPNYSVIPEYLSLVKKPKKKKNIFTLVSPEIYILSNFIGMIKKLKYPDPYKLKGIRYVGEFFNIKEGKKKKHYMLRTIL